MNLDKLNNKFYLSDIQKNLSSIANLNFSLDEHLKLKKFLSSDALLKEQMSSLLIFPEVVSNPFKSRNGLRDNFIDEFPNIDIDLQVDNLKNAYLKKDLSSTKMQRDSDGSEVLDSNLIETILSNLVDSIVPKTLSLLKPSLNNDTNRVNFSNVSSFNKFSSDSFLNLNSSILNGLDNLNTDLFALPTIIPNENNFKYCGGAGVELEGFDKLKLGQESKKYINLGKVNRVRNEINDVTYDDFESKKIEDVLTSTGNFDNQVEINDFIRRICGFKSLLFKVDPEGTNEALFDAVKLAGSLRGSSKDLQDNNSVVSLIYDLFQGNDENLSFMMNDLTSLKRNIFNDDNGLGKDVDLNLDLKQRLKHALLSLDKQPKSNNLNNSSGFGDITNSHAITSNLESVGGVMRDNDKNVILEDLKDFLSWARSVDFSRIIVDPLRIHLINMETIISDLTDTLMYFTQNVSIRNNMGDYQMGNESSRMP